MKIRLLLFCLLSTMILGCSSMNSENNSKEHLDRNTKNVNNASVKSTNNIHSQSFLYEPSVSIIEGIICKKAVCAVSHELEDSKPKDTIIVIALSNKISIVNPEGVDTTNYDENPPNEYNIDTIQLVLPGYHSLDKSIGHLVHLTGTFFHGDNGNHFTDILLSVKQIKDGNDSTVYKY